MSSILVCNYRQNVLFQSLRVLLCVTIIEYNLSLIPVVIIVVQLFDRAFLFQCLLCNHSFKTNPNSNILTYTFLLCLYISLLHYKHFWTGLLYRLSELCGLSRWRRYFQSIGLLHNSIQELVQCTSTLLLKGEEFVRDVRTSRIAFRALCTFLHGLATTSNNLDSVRYTKIDNNAKERHANGAL